VRRLDSQNGTASSPVRIPDCSGEVGVTSVSVLISGVALGSFRCSEGRRLSAILNPVRLRIILLVGVVVVVIAVAACTRVPGVQYRSQHEGAVLVKPGSRGFGGVSRRLSRPHDEKSLHRLSGPAHEHLQSASWAACRSRQCQTLFAGLMRFTQRAGNPQHLAPKARPA